MGEPVSLTMEQPDAGGDILFYKQPIHANLLYSFFHVLQKYLLNKNHIYPI